MPIDLVVPRRLVQILEEQGWPSRDVFDDPTAVWLLSIHEEGPHVCERLSHALDFEHILAEQPAIEAWVKLPGRFRLLVFVEASGHLIPYGFAPADVSDEAVEAAHNVGGVRAIIGLTSDS